LLGFLLRLGQNAAVCRDNKGLREAGSSPDQEQV
jgi:hypothetical protein